MDNPFNNKKVLVTGGTGFIGSAVVKALLNRGDAVRILDNNCRGSVSKLGGDANLVELVEGDVRDLNSVCQAMKGVDSVYHLAYINGTEYFYHRPELILEVAVKGMMNVLDACLSENVRELVLASSSEVYQEAPFVPTAENVPLVVPDVLNPRFSYGGGKIISELLAINYGRKYFEKVVIIRPHNVYGPDMGREHVIPQFAIKMNKLTAQETGELIEFPIQGSGEETRSFIYIDDFVRALMNVVAEARNLDIVHIGTDREVSIRDVAGMVSQCYDRKIVLVPSERLKGSPLRRCPDVSRLTSLGFNPAVSLEVGIRRTVDWYRRNENL